jgi:penicillin-binding protein 2
MSVSIGQGYNLATPLQMAQVAAAIASGGIIYRPQLVEKVESPSGEVLFQSQPEIKYRLGASPATIAAVRRGLEGVVEEERGTARVAQLANIRVAGKTGTAQVVSLEKEKSGKNNKKYENHAWFVAYAPAENPRVAVAVIVEHGGHGGSTAAPLAKRVVAAAMSEPPAQVAKSE